MLECCSWFSCKETQSLLSCFDIIFTQITKHLYCKENKLTNSDQLDFEIIIDNEYSKLEILILQRTSQDLFLFKKIITSQLTTLVILSGKKSAL